MPKKSKSSKARRSDQKPKERSIDPIELLKERIKREPGRPQVTNAISESTDKFKTGRYEA